MTRTPRLLAVLSLMTAVASPAAARADVFGPFSLLSSSPGEQVIYARDPAISADGRYVAFDGDYRGLTGVWRRAVSGGAIEPVAVGAPRTAAGSAELPSISANGRYVSFTTTARLDPVDDKNEAPDVYVRDMQDPSSEPCRAPDGEEEALGVRPVCSFVLASARNGSAAGLSYAYREPVAEGPLYGSVASGRSAISADGDEVAFVTTAESDLAGAGTPPLQVGVRDLATDTTQLVSVRYDPATGAPAVDPATGETEPVSSLEGTDEYGAVFVGASAQHTPGFRESESRAAPLPIGASISADGSTVAWLGTDIALQAATLPADALAPKYSEPLWRRIGDGPSAPTRRVTGGSDPTAPACVASGETSPSACQGPFDTLATPTAPGTVAGFEGDEDVLPRLSADGYTVAFLADAPLVALGEGFGSGDGHTDVYVADMHPGLSRDQALRPLTELASASQTDVSTTGPIVDLAVSPDGSQVAFTTKRTQFPLSSPAYVTPPSASAGMLELFDADLASDTLTQVTQGFEGGQSEHPHEPARPGEDPYTSAGDGALSPSFSQDGNQLAFSSTASNLVYGDGNTPPAGEAFGPFDGSDVFLTARTVFGSAEAAQQVAPPPANPTATLVWELGATAASQRDGSVLLYVGVPGAGTLSAAARSAVVVHEALSARRARRGRAARVRPRTRVATESVARGTLAVPRQSLVVLRLVLSPRYGALATRSGGLTAAVTVTFTAPGHPALHQSLEATFVRKVRNRATQSASRTGKGRHG